MGPPMSALSMPQYSGNLNNPNQADVHQVPSHYDHLVQQSHGGGYASGFYPNAGLMPQNYSGSVHFQPSLGDYGTKLPNDDYKYTNDQIIKMSTTPPPPPAPSAPTQQQSTVSVQPSSTIPLAIKSDSEPHMSEANWNQMYGHHQVYGPPNEYSQMQQNYANPNPKYWS